MPARRASGFLRPEPSRFLGRATELARIDTPLREGKIVAIVGPSGIGKTRLAQRYAVTRQEAYAGVWFCDLREARDVEQMTDAIRRRLTGASSSAVGDGATLASLERALEARAGALVVLDDVDHVLPAASETILRLSRSAPEVRFIVTSRSRLGVGEEVVELGALPLPIAGERLSDAVDLFVDRVRTHRGSYSPCDDELAKIAAIVKGVDGIPLAIELAAARFDDDTNFTVGTTPAPGASRAAHAIERGFALLSQAEQIALQHASVFRGSFGLAAAADVVQLDLMRVEEVVTNLARKSLLQVERHEPLRFMMSESIRSFSAAHLRASRNPDGPAWRHLQHFVARATESQTDTSLRHPLDQDDRPDLQAAMEFAARADNPTAVLRLAIAIDGLGLGALGRDEVALLDEALRAGGARDLPLAARALGVRAAASYATGRLDEAKKDAETAVRLATELSDHRQIGAMSKVAGEACFQLGEFDRAEAHLGRALKIADARRDDKSLSAVRYLLGSLHQSRGDRQRARIEFGLSLAIAVRSKDAAGEARAEMGLAWEHLDLGDHAGARTRYERAIALAKPLGLERTVRIVTGYLGILRFDEGTLDEAEAQLRQATYASKRAGDPRLEGIFEGVRGAVLATLGRLAESRRSFALADELLAANPFYAEMIAIHRGHLDLAESRAAARRGDATAAASHLECAQARIAAARAPGASGESFVQRSDDARLAVRILERHLER